jgi:N-acetyl sugar amidotransferase
MKMRYCKRCLQPDTRPGIVFDDEQICFACRYEESKKTIDWAAREAELQSFADEAKEEAKKRGNTYDCIIGVSGGKDSTFQAVYAKEKLGLNPLLINCMPDEITEIGQKNIQNLNNLGFDIISIRLNPTVAKKLARKSFFERGNIIAASEYCLWASSYIMAVKFNIPLIIQGENAALTLGAAKNQEATGNAFSVMQLETIRGASVDSFVDLSNNITEKDLFLYKIPTVEEMQEKGIKAIFLQYYTRKWSQVTNADFAVARGLTGRTDDLHALGRYRRYTALDCDLQIPNQMIKYLKFGFGYATDEICYDIREGRFTREDGKWYVKEYDGLCGEQYIEKACKYLSITKEEFWEVVDRFVNRDLFEKIDGKWVPKFTVGEDFES